MNPNENAPLGGEVERIWLKSYPPGVPADIDPRSTRAWSEMFDRAVAAVRRQAGVPQHGPDDQLTPTSTAVARLRRVAAGEGACQGRARRDHDAERACSTRSRCSARCAPAAPSSTSIRSTPRASSSTSCKDSGAEAIVILENFAATLQQVLAKTPVKHIVVTSLGEMLGLKGLIVNLVVRKVKKMVPAVRPARRGRFKRRALRRAAASR